MLGSAPTPESDRIVLDIPPHIMRKYMERRLSLWAEFSGIYVDRRRFSFDGHQYLMPLFDDRSEHIVLLKAAQMGATVYMLVKAFHMALYPQSWGFDIPIKIGFYFPEARGIGRIVRDRVQPMLESCSDLRPYSREARLDLKPVGNSTLYFLYMGGRSSKDSVPLNALFIDEVRLVNLHDVHQTNSRLLHSKPYKFKNYVSTAGMPNSDIHRLFLNTDKKWFHTICQHCGTEQILAQEFPECIAVPAPHSTVQEYYYICKKPTCRGRIEDNQFGMYIAENPGHEYSGYHISQLISYNITPKEIWERYRDTTDFKGFYNDILGLPYVDTKNKPISLDMLDDFVNPFLEWGDKCGGPYYAGIDQMMGYNYMFIIERPADKKWRIVWFEIIEDEKPFRRCAELMEEFDVRVCLCDALPNATEALEFANHFNKRVFLAFSGQFKDPISWEDDHKTKKKHKKASPETFGKYKVLIDAYQSLDHTLSRLGEGCVEWPDPRGHLISCHPYNGGRVDHYPIMETHAYHHFDCPVRERVLIEEETGKSRMRWNFAGIQDPHALSAFNLAMWASERKKSTFSFSF